MNVPLVDVAIDYVTMTAMEPHSASLLLEAAYGAAYYEKSVNHEESKPTGLQGYRGMVTGKVMYGEREDGIMVRISGKLAHEFVLGLGSWGKLCNVPRIDIQATGKLEWDNRWYAQQEAQKARASSHGAAMGRQSRVDLYDGDARGSTCSIGSRSSARYLRLYDKTREQGFAVEPNLWRWEVEYKKPLAHPLLCAILESRGSLNFIAGTVYSEFQAKGVQPPWGVLEVQERVKTERHQSTVEKTLDWLKTSVRPTLERLQAMGYTREAMFALGLPASGSDEGTGNSMQDHGPKSDVG